MSFYVTAMSYLIKDAQDQWICKFFSQAQDKPKLKHMFTTQVGYLLRNLDENSQNECWKVWLKDYWNNRLQGVPCPLDDAEISMMFKWVVHLQEVFPEAVNIVLRMPSIHLDPYSYSSFLNDIPKTKLIDHYPQELAKLLIHLGKPDHLPWFWKHNLDFLHKLQGKNLPDELAQELDNLILRIEIS